MQRRTFSIHLGLVACVLALGACAGKQQDDTREPSEQASSEASASESASGGVIEGATLGKELPPELVADLRLQGADADGRLLTLAPGFVATAECSDCGAPSYLWFLAVRCADTHHCEVLTERCEGAIEREDEIFVIDLRPIESDAAEICAGYSGTFELP